MADAAPSRQPDSYQAYLRSPHWRKTRQMRLRHDGFRCVGCGKPATEVHHRSYARLRREELEDLRSVCHKCHSLIHRLTQQGRKLGAATDDILTKDKDLSMPTSKAARKRARKKARVPHKAGALRRDIAAMKKRQAKQSAQAATRDD